MGEQVEGVLVAPDRTLAISKIRDMGLSPLVLVEKRGSANIKLPDIFGGVKLHEKIIFTRNLAGMLSAGLSLYRALSVLEKQTVNETFKKILIALSAEIDRGGSLSDGLLKYPKVFSPLFISMVKAGEESGNLSGSLKEIGLNLEKSYELNKKIKGALTYPTVIVSAIVLIGVLMMIFVVPTLTKTFTELGVDLPTSTKFVIFVSTTLKENALILLGLVVMFFVGMWYLLKVQSVKRAIDYIVLRIPVIGLMIKEVNAARTARTLSSLLSSGVSITRALTITKEVLQNSYYKQVIDKGIKGIEQGSPISASFKEHKELYPVMVGEMMEVGEETGKLAQMLLDIAVFYEGEVDNKTKNLSTIIEPVLMIFIGAAVGFFAISMLTPMYSLMDSIN